MATTSDLCETLSKESEVADAGVALKCENYQESYTEHCAYVSVTKAEPSSSPGGAQEIFSPSNKADTDDSVKCCLKESISCVEGSSDAIGNFNVFDGLASENKQGSHQDHPDVAMSSVEPRTDCEAFSHSIAMSFETDSAVVSNDNCDSASPLTVIENELTPEKTVKCDFPSLEDSAGEPEELESSETKITATAVALVTPRSSKRLSSVKGTKLAAGRPPDSARNCLSKTVNCRDRASKRKSFALVSPIKSKLMKNRRTSAELTVATRRRSLSSSSKEELSKTPTRTRRVPQVASTLASQRPRRDRTASRNRSFGNIPPLIQNVRPTASGSSTARGNNAARSAEKHHAELFRKDLISAMKMADTEVLQPDEYLEITDTWKLEWEKGVQVPVAPEEIVQANVHTVDANATDDDVVGEEKNFAFPEDRFLHAASDLSFRSEVHQLYDAVERSRTACRYDLDELDVAWLSRFNDLLEEMGHPMVSEACMERAVEAMEVLCADRLQLAVRTVEGLGIEYDENVVCDVCKSPDGCEGNEMVFCDSCDICVHQACYGISQVPDGAWMCRPCSVNVTPSCILCPRPGGAMKPIQGSLGSGPSKTGGGSKGKAAGKGGKCLGGRGKAAGKGSGGREPEKTGPHWAHINCAWWIPEVTFGCLERMEPVVNVSHVPSSRWALVCVVCRERTGACIQCAYKTCKTSFHVSCAYTEGLEMSDLPSTADEKNAPYQLMAFCKKHSDADDDDCKMKDGEVKLGDDAKVDKKAETMDTGQQDVTGAECKHSERTVASEELKCRVNSRASALHMIEDDVTDVRTEVANNGSSDQLNSSALHCTCTQYRDKLNSGDSMPACASCRGEEKVKTEQIYPRDIKAEICDIVSNSEMKQADLCRTDDLRLVANGATSVKSSNSGNLDRILHTKALVSANGSRCDVDRRGEKAVCPESSKDSCSVEAKKGTNLEDDKSVNKTRLLNQEDKAESGEEVTRKLVETLGLKQSVKQTTPSEAMPFSQLSTNAMNSRDECALALDTVDQCNSTAVVASDKYHVKTSSHRGAVSTAKPASYMSWKQLSAYGDEQRLNEEEKKELRSYRLRRLTEEFYDHVGANEVAGQLDIDDVVVDFLFQYWLLKRKSAFNKPLLAAKVEEEEDVTRQREDSLFARMKMFIHLRQDLERVRNLCYMVNKRERLRTLVYRMKTEIFCHQLAVLHDIEVPNVDEGISEQVMCELEVSEAWSEDDRVLIEGHRMTNTIYDQPDGILHAAKLMELAGERYRVASSRKCTKSVTKDLKARTKRSELDVVEGAEEDGEIGAEEKIVPSRRKHLNNKNAPGSAGKAKRVTAVHKVKTNGSIANERRTTEMRNGLVRPTAGNAELSSKIVRGLAGIKKKLSAGNEMQRKLSSTNSDSDGQSNSADVLQQENSVSENDRVKTKEVERTERRQLHQAAQKRKGSFEELLAEGDKWLLERKRQASDSRHSKNRVLGGMSVSKKLPVENSKEESDGKVVQKIPSDLGKLLKKRLSLKRDDKQLCFNHEGFDTMLLQANEPQQMQEQSNTSVPVSQDLAVGTGTNTSSIEEQSAKHNVEVSDVNDKLNEIVAETESLVQESSENKQGVLNYVNTHNRLSLSELKINNTAGEKLSENSIKISHPVSKKPACRRSQRSSRSDAVHPISFAILERLTREQLLIKDEIKLKLSAGLANLARLSRLAFDNHKQRLLKQAEARGLNCDYYMTKPIVEVVENSWDVDKQELRGSSESKCSSVEEKVAGKNLPQNFSDSGSCSSRMSGAVQMSTVPGSQSVSCQNSISSLDSHKNLALQQTNSCADRGLSKHSTPVNNVSSNGLRDLRVGRTHNVEVVEVSTARRPRRACRRKMEWDYEYGTGSDASHVSEGDGDEFQVDASTQARRNSARKPRLRSAVIVDSDSSCSETHAGLSDATSDGDSDRKSHTDTEEDTDGESNAESVYSVENSSELTDFNEDVS